MVDALNAAANAQEAAWVCLCSKSAPIICSGVFLAPVPTVANIMVNKSVGSLPFLPYSSMAVNAFIWAVYGIVNKEYMIWAPNIFGLIMGLSYCVQYSKYVPKNANNLPGRLNQHLQLGGLLMTFTILIAITLDKALASVIIGKLAVIVCVVLFASPLSTLKEVIVTRSAKSIPLP
jgi:solute carrier family 50 protein (sugar transporter)